jgi:hypothetical protein
VIPKTQAVFGWTLIGAKTTVTKDVPPYVILAGNPGKVIRVRFEKLMVDELLRLAWWDLPDEIVDALLPILEAV